MEYTDMKQLPLVLSVDQVSSVLQLGKTTTYALIRSGRIKSNRIGHQIRISKAALLEFLAA